MARAAKAVRDTAGGGAARVAARRRDAWKGNETPSKGVPKKAGAKPGGKSARGRASSSSSSFGKLGKVVKLGLLVGAMLCIGFFAVLVVDVTAGFVGKVRLGEVTVVELWHKMVDRVLDRDVPRPAPEAAPVRSAARPAPHTAPAPSARAPVPAARPEEDARHVVEPRAVDKGADPQVQRARQRLDELLGRL